MKRVSIFEKLEFTANPRAVPFMPYGASFEPHAAPSSHLIVRKGSLPRSRIFTYPHQAGEYTNHT
ncbi:hypothetical protein MKN04_25430 [Paenibacillus polymyxa]|uniref:hypothetical protein n=1 Tax=Paenibacillus polymyxa TaxID=1406 RepID=UPI0018AF8A72|nr:hypothetical protein [Paenibacillus polymyxa]MCH6190947.1 hypothetical protein [Paenibacillus polymyxa]